MSQSTRSSGGKARQPWTPDQAPRGVTCPACGLANEPGARVCRNCGLPVASASDPLRGVVPGRVELPGARRSGLSAAIGLALVVGLLLVGGSLVASGGGFFGGGPAAPGAEASPGTAADDAAADGAEDAAAEVALVDGPDTEAAADDGTAPTEGETGGHGNSFGYTCENGAIEDLGRSRWFLSQFQVGERLSEEGNYDRITWEMSKRGSGKNGTTVTMEWTTPRDARSAYGADLVSGTRAIVLTFDGPVETPVGQQVDELSLEPEGVEQIRTVDMFEGEDGKVRTVVGLRGESCARMSSTGWTKKAKVNNGKVYLDVEKF